MLKRIDFGCFFKRNLNILANGLVFKLDFFKTTKKVPFIIGFEILTEAMVCDI